MRKSESAAKPSSALMGISYQVFPASQQAAVRVGLERPECPADCLDGPQALERDKPPGLGAAGPARAATRGGVLVGRLVCGELKPGKRNGRLSRPGLPRPVWARGGRITLSYGTDWTPDPTVKLSVTGS